MHLVFRVQAADISIHALREEGDARPIPPLVCVTVFLSTPSARRATQWMFAQSSVMVISIHALREEGDIPFSSASSDSFLFLSTPSARRATRTSMGTTAGWRISIHALREEGDYMRMMQLLSNAVFLSTPSARRATSKLFHSLTRHDDFYPRPPRGGRPAGRTYGQQVLFISIHALREEGDLRKTVDRPEPSGFLSTPSARRATLTRETRRVPWEISIHALREEGDRCCQKYCPGCRYFYPRPPRGGRLLRGELEPIGFLFLSTPSARRATHLGEAPPVCSRYFYPRPPRGGRHIIQDYVLEGKKFLSTPSARRATLTLYHADVLRLISIHALREEGDAVSCSLVLMPCYFYPRPPRGGRQRVHPNGSRAAHFYPRPPRGGRLEEQVENNSTDVFLSTPSARRATLRGGRTGLQPAISIHALREEGDLRCGCCFLRHGLFLSTPSARRATAKTEKNISAFVSL